jgi:hypothetical protein
MCVGGDWRRIGRQSAKKEAGAREKREERFVATKAGAIGKESEAKMRRRREKMRGEESWRQSEAKRRGVVLESECEWV